ITQNPNCTNNGTCIITFGDDKNTTGCNCTSQFSGDRCELLNPCSSDACKNGGTCISNGTDFHCNCSGSPSHLKYRFLHSCTHHLSMDSVIHICLQKIVMYNCIQWYFCHLQT